MLSKGLAEKTILDTVSFFFEISIVFYVHSEPFVSLKVLRFSLNFFFHYNETFSC